MKGLKISLLFLKSNHVFLNHLMSKYLLILEEREYVKTYAVVVWGFVCIEILVLICMLFFNLIAMWHICSTLSPILSRP